MMKKIGSLVTATLFTVLSASTFACPKGTTLQGGTGPHHKGGTCVAVKTAKTEKQVTQVKEKVTSKTTQAAANTKKAAKTTTTEVKQETIKTVNNPLQ